MKPFVFAVGLLAALASPSLAKEKPQPFKLLTGAFFAVSVPNLTESVQWYSENLGLTVSLETSGGGVDVRVLEGGGLIVELIRDPTAQPPGAARQGIFKAGFIVKDFDRTVDELRVRNVSIAFGPFPASNTQRANLIVRDNAGNLIQIFGE
jgi:catechol 2,3-dioxygenase-like lactoylglutathione lyase family enzyme